MWLMLHKDQPDDYVIASGALHSVREFVETTFSYLDLDCKKYLRIDPELFRPFDNIKLCGNPAKAASELNWTAARTLVY
jgi:GDPmannose 4,6-dehydratase